MAERAKKNCGSPDEHGEFAIAGGHSSLHQADAHGIDSEPKKSQEVSEDFDESMTMSH